MNIRQRLRFLNSLAQAAPAAADPSAAAATPATPTATPVAPIDVRALPNFKPQLFAARPDAITDINKIVNIINSGLSTISQGKVSFLQLWNNPSLSGDAYTNSIKNLTLITRWLYTVLKSDAPQYSVPGIRQVGVSLIDMARGYSWPEPNADSIQDQLVVAGQNLVSKIGGASSP